MKIGIVVCTNSGADYHKFDYPVEIIHSYLHLDDDLYEDYVDITAEEFYEKIAANPNIDVKTSQPPVGKILDTYEKLKNSGYSHILVITISKMLSGIYQTAKLASDMLEGVKISVINSKTVSYGELYLVLEAIKYIQAGKEFDEIVELLENKIKDINILVYVDTLKYLVKNGRLSVAGGALGSLLKIKPILRMDQHTGKVIPFQRIRTSRKALLKIIEIFEEETKDRDVDIFIAYTNNLELAKQLASKLLEIKPNSKIELTPLTPVVGAHAGPGTLGIGYVFI